LKAVLLEAVAVGGIGLLLALAANALSPHGLDLTQNFFPGAGQTASANSKALTDAGTSSATNSGHMQMVAAQLRQQGLQAVEGNEAARLFHDPAHDTDQIVFVDARDDEHYQAGHIPGAYQFDHYHAERYFSTVLPVCQQAQQIIVYCNGGDCEDSKFAAIILRDSAGVTKEKLFVYTGGMTEWQASGLPVELGARQSGNLRK